MNNFCFYEESLNVYSLFIIYTRAYDCPVVIGRKRLAHTLTNWRKHEKILGNHLGRR